MNKRLRWAALVLGSLVSTDCVNDRVVSVAVRYSAERSEPPLRALPPDGIRLTFVDTPQCHIGVVAPQLRQTLKLTEGSVVQAQFSIRCAPLQAKVRSIGLLAVNGIAISPQNQDGWMESVGDGSDPFRGVCR